MKAAAAMAAQGSNDTHSFLKVGDNTMRKCNYKILILAASLALSAGCGKKENRYTYREAGITALNTGDYDNAIKAFDQAIDASKGLVGKFDVDVLKYRAEAEYLAEDYKAAAVTYDVLIQVDKETPEYLIMRCISRAGAGDLNGALEDFKRSRELDPEKKTPGSGKALLAAGAAMEANGAAEDAMTLYEEARSQGEESAELFNRMGLCKMAEENWDKAVEYFGLGLSAPDADMVPELMFNQAVCLEHKGNFDSAKSLMEQYITLHGPDEEAERELEFLKTR